MRCAVLSILLAAALAQHENHAAMNMPSAPAPAEAPFCVTKPSAKNCTSFQLTPAAARADLDSLCKAMDFMPACSVARLCAAAAPNASATDGAWTGRVGPGAAVCAPFNLLATVCAHDKGMGGMAGCRTHYAGMCAEGSVVAQCREVPGLAQLPTTKAVNDAVKQLCTANPSRPGCVACVPAFKAGKTYGSCDLLSTWADICYKEEKLPQCTDYGMLCAKEGSWVFCRGSALLATKQLATNVASPPVVASGALRRSGPAAAAAASVVAAAGLLLVV